MSNLNRINAINAVAELAGTEPAPAAPIEPDHNYAADVFDAKAMREYLPKDTCSKLLATIETGAPLDVDIATNVAHAMKKEIFTLCLFANSCKLRKTPQMQKPDICVLKPSKGHIPGQSLIWIMTRPICRSLNHKSNRF